MTSPENGEGDAGNDWGFETGNPHRGAVLCLWKTRSFHERFRLLAISATLNPA